MPSGRLEAQQPEQTFDPNMPTPITDDQLFVHAKHVKDKVVVTTGAASGIGREAVLTFAKHGSKVVIADLDVVGGEAASSKASRKKAGMYDPDPAEGIFIKCDVTQWDDQVNLFELGTAWFDHVDIVIPNAGINESEQVCCWGNVKFLDGKPAKPNLLTLDVNLTGVIYTAHLGMYYMKRDRPAGAWKSLVMIGSMASWVGLFTAQQYTAKHGVLGLMRSLDPVVEGEDIRMACIHPWFTETNIIDWKTKALTAGMPTTPVERVAGAIFRAATDPDPATSGCPWMLPDDGPLLLLKKEVLREGVYEMLNNRVRRVRRSTLLFWSAVFHDLGRLLRPVLISNAVVGLGLATVLKLRS